MNAAATPGSLGEFSGAQKGVSFWRRVLIVLAGISICLSAVSIWTEGVTPSAVVFSILMAAGLWRLRSGGTKGTVFIGISALR